MSRQEPPRHPLPGAELPSAEVLDELLRAFSVDVTDQEGMDEVDLASPEVAELLTPPGQGEPSRPAEPDPRPQPEVEVEFEVEVEVEAVGGPGAEVEAEAGPEASGPTPEHVEEADGQTEGQTDERAAEQPDEQALVDEPVTAPVAPIVPDPVEDADDAPAPAPKTIVIDAADDPPDAVYLAAGDPLLMRPVRAEPPVVAAEPGSADGQVSGDSTIFIDDRQTGETISIEAASSATRIEPRMRERRIAVRRSEGRKRLRWVFLVAIVLVVVVATLAVLGSSLFAIRDVEVEGAVYTDPAALAAVVADLEGTPVLRADTDGAERDLETIPWVEDARVTTDFPHGVKIEIRERQPVATFEGSDGRFRVIDSHGRVLDVLDSQPVEYLLLVSADAPALEAGQFAPQGFGAAASLARALTPELRARAQSVAVTPDGSDLRLMLADGIEVRFGAARDLVVKLVRLQTRLDELDSGPMSYVDVSTNEVTTG